MFIVLCLFWISTAFVSLGPGWGYGIGLMNEGGVEGAVATLVVIAGGAGSFGNRSCDWWKRQSRYGLYAAIGISVAYAIIGTILVPRLWADPLRADVKDLAHHYLALCGVGDLGRSLMLYLVLKYVHIIGASVLLGTGAGIAFFMLVAHLGGKPVIIAGVARIVVIADFIFTATAVVISADHGHHARLERRLFAMGRMDRVSGWIVLYLITGGLWLPVVWMQMRLRDLASSAAVEKTSLPAEYYRIFWIWFAFGVPAFAAVAIILADDSKASDKISLWLGKLNGSRTSPPN